MGTFAGNFIAFILYSLIILSTSYYGFIHSQDAYGSFLLNISASVITTIAMIFLNDVKNLSKRSFNIRIYLASIFTPRQKVRVSMSYIYKIVIDNRYLLIKNLKSNLISPVGGCYKYFEGAKSFFDKIKVRSAVEANTNDYPQIYDSDLRLIFCIKYLKKFLEWFETGNAREYEVRREFKEELIDTGLISNKVLFENLKFVKLNTNKTFSYNWSKRYYNYHYYDVFEVLLSDEQKNYIKDLINSSDSTIRDNLYSVTDREIECVSMDIGKRIGDHAKFLLE